MQQKQKEIRNKEERKEGTSDYRKRPAPVELINCHVQPICSAQQQRYHSTTGPTRTKSVASKVMSLLVLQSALIALYINPLLSALPFLYFVCAHELELFLCSSQVINISLAFFLRERISRVRGPRARSIASAASRCREERLRRRKSNIKSLYSRRTFLVRIGIE